MSDKPENPPAFPVSSIDGFTQHGMDLRDWFAGQVMPNLAVTSDGVTTIYRTAEAIAKASYAIADAMLTARQSQEPPHEG